MSNYLYIGAGALALISTLAIVFFGNLVARKKEAELKAYQVSADIRIADADSRAANAYSAAAHANALAQKAALDKAKIEQDNLLLQEKIEKEREARLEIERKIAQRYMTVSQMGQVWGIEQDLGIEPVDVVFCNDDPEARFLAENLSVALQKWSPTLIGMTCESARDVVIYFDMTKDMSGKRAALITSALKRASPMTIRGPFAASQQFLRNSIPNLQAEPPRAAIRVVVGYR